MAESENAQTTRKAPTLRGATGFGLTAGLLYLLLVLLTTQNFTEVDTGSLVGGFVVMVLFGILGWRKRVLAATCWISAALGASAGAQVGGSVTVPVEWFGLALVTAVVMGPFLVYQLPIILDTLFGVQKAEPVT